MELVIAPEPKTSVSAETVEEWQRRAQWSMLLVFKTTRANFCMMIVVFIGGLGRGQAANLLRPVGFEFFHYQLIGFIPGGFKKDSILLYQRLGETILAVDKLMCIPALLA